MLAAFLFLQGAVNAGKGGWASVWEQELAGQHRAGWEQNFLGNIINVGCLAQVVVLLVVLLKGKGILECVYMKEYKK